MSKPALFYQRKKQLPMILQNQIAECGLACIAMVSNFWGHDLDLNFLRSFDSGTVTGTTLLSICETLDQLGFNTRAFKVPMSEIQLIKCPAIIHWNMNHFVVLKAVTRKYVIIHDPATGVVRYTFEQFSASFTGIVLEVEQAINFKPVEMSRKFKLMDFVNSVSGVNKFLLLLLLLSLAIEFFSLLNPLLMQYVTDNVINTRDKGNLYTMVTAFAILAFVHGMADWVRSNMVIYLSNNLTAQFSTNIVKHILKLPVDFFAQRHKADIQSKFQSIEQIQKKVSTDFVTAVLDGVMILLNMVIMAIYSKLLTAICLFSLLVFLVLRTLSYQVLNKQTQVSIIEHAKANAVFLEIIQSIMAIKSFARENYLSGWWRNYYYKALNADIRVAKMNAVYTVINQILLHLEQIAIICLGSLLVMANQFSLGMLFAFIGYRTQLVNKASTLIQNVFEYRLISIQLNRLGDIIAQPPELVNSGAGNIATVRGDLTLKNIYFSYGNQNELLSAISLQINAGEKVVITGSSGCGKTTLLKIAMGLLQCSSGEILIDGQPLEQFGLKNYRAMTASVLQDDMLLSGSIKDNITFFDERTDYEQLYSVAELACADQFIRQFPMGYETLVGERGVMLSGGQKQRILLARALYRRPRFLFLDEASSHLDVENECRINQSLKSLQITQIIVAHRQETIAMADRVINLANKNDIIN
ncbi:peptidase domain-containing ABC transporter [Legionella dresdenensis]|uniref:Peptidase domain-containing ABC transporter n=1 Tax=Legionella dresdenensis TaxID=450200 RepID=A0ABV8CFE7_9GAMM